MLLRHLAAALLPLAATTAGVVAVGIALQIPAGPGARVSVPLAVPPVAAVAPVVAPAAPRRERMPARPAPMSATAGTPPPMPVAALAPSLRDSGRAAAADGPGVPVPVSGGRPPRDETTPLMPPVAPEPAPQPDPGPARVSSTAGVLEAAPAPKPVEVGHVRAAKQHGKRERGDSKPNRAAVAVLSMEPRAPEVTETDSTEGAGKNGKQDDARVPCDSESSTGERDGAGADGGESGAQVRNGHSEAHGKGGGKRVD